MALWETIGILAAILIAAGWLPEVIQGYKTKKLRDVAWWLLIIELAGSALFLAYGFHIQDSVVMAVNIAVGVMILLLILMKASFKR